MLFLKFRILLGVTDIFSFSYVSFSTKLLSLGKKKANEMLNFNISNGIIYLLEALHDLLGRFHSSPG